MRPTVILRGSVLLLASGIMVYIAKKMIVLEVRMKPMKYPNELTDPNHKTFVCQMETQCPEDQFPFKITSGAANVVGPNICFNGETLISTVKNNVGKGINIALVNATNGQLITINFFDMWTGKIEQLVDFLKDIKLPTILLLASFDDPSTKMNDEAKKLFTELGSSLIFSLGFRDNWVFVGAKPIKGKSPFEQIIKNNKEKNKYENWPEAIEIEGCVPRKTD
ncbi:protein FAM3C-like [Rhinoraja longicauda]